MYFLHSRPNSSYFLGLSMCLVWTGKWILIVSKIKAIRTVDKGNTFYSMDFGTILACDFLFLSSFQVLPSPWATFSAMLVVDPNSGFAVLIVHALSLWPLYWHYSQLPQPTFLSLSVVSNTRLIQLSSLRLYQEGTGKLDSSSLKLKASKLIWILMLHTISIFSYTSLSPVLHRFKIFPLLKNILFLLSLSMNDLTSQKRIGTNPKIYSICIFCFLFPFGYSVYCEVGV